ncbi:alpha/beta fold hydrolase [Sphingobium subterraneum]|uniref:3-oxoadipate enol-lactonase n=1 Tax=Sphingobium subterraneum TaxID=627688 RepID=A0A841J259_9SPHN|nr:alpha/beta hydrolase [Sphingobium subterraneum]MBB6123626.1 3-oxoadipate enol-lactonase [Sphingobium subterraneum]
MKSATGIAVRDTILWVDDTGEADLPPILCLHSLFLDGRMFDALVPAAKGRFRVIRPDFRGQGSSAPSTDALVTMDCCADDMIALIETLALPPVHLIAASMGGDVAVRIAARRPDLCASMVMMGSSARGEPEDQKGNFTDLLDRTRAIGFVGDDLDMMMSIMFGATTRSKPEKQAMIEHWRTHIGRLAPSTWAAMVGVVERPSAVSLLPRVKAPTLVYLSDEDIARPQEWTHEVADNIPGATLQRLEAVGHSPILEIPDIVIPQTLDFMAGAQRALRTQPAHTGA